MALKMPQGYGMRKVDGKGNEKQNKDEEKREERGRREK